jgi:BirA family biotin operon repressor/biotin-[acetyl-CoA-carboxylase] ligase
MNIIKLDAIDSTNSYLKKLDRKEPLPDGTVVQTEHQTKGRGQQGTDWQSDKGKNLTFSILKRFSSFAVIRQFELSITVSLVISTILERQGIPISIKWPNDILAGNDKIAGILIENSIKRGMLSSTVIGIGINVNQVDFPESVGQATSMNICSGREYDRTTLLYELINALFKALDRLESTSFEELKPAYLKRLYRFRQQSHFVDDTGTPFEGRIVDVDQEGKLIILTTGGKTRSFLAKQVQFADRKN